MAVGVAVEEVDGGELADRDGEAVDVAVAGELVQIALDVLASAAEAERLLEVEARDVRLGLGGADAGDLAVGEAGDAGDAAEALAAGELRVEEERPALPRPGAQVEGAGDAGPGVLAAGDAVRAGIRGREYVVLLGDDGALAVDGVGLDRRARLERGAGPRRLDRAPFGSGVRARRRRGRRRDRFGGGPRRPGRRAPPLPAGGQVRKPPLNLALLAFQLALLRVQVLRRRRHRRGRLRRRRARRFGGTGGGVRRRPGRGRDGRRGAAPRQRRQDRITATARGAGLQTLHGGLR